MQIKMVLKNVCPKNVYPNVAPFCPEDKPLQTHMTRVCNFLIRIFS